MFDGDHLIVNFKLCVILSMLNLKEFYVKSKREAIDLKSNQLWS